MSDRATTPPILVMMGASGCGKTTVGRALATRLGWTWREGDEFHPQANLEKMQAGIPLDDADRVPWLTAIGHWMDAQAHDGEPAVIACSALKRSYRDSLRDGRAQVWFLYLRVSRAELERRVQTRHHPYMPASLLDSQLAALEEPQPDEPRSITIEAGGSVTQTVAAAMRELGARDRVGSTGENR
ncbi:MAG: gluconokinase [Rhodanobacteraceae bacterium]